MNQQIHTLIERYPALEVCQTNIERAYEHLADCFTQGGKLLLCGNGGSCADSDHIAGELLKGFLKKRPLSGEEKATMRKNCPTLEEDILEKLQKGLPAVPLTAMTALITAFCNDVDPDLVYAQQVLALGNPGDLLLGISTSGNAKNVVIAAKVAKSRGMKVVALTGERGGVLKTLADVTVAVPACETYQVQELHLPVYHCLCAAVEEYFFKC